MNQSELQFILRLRDEATAILKKHGLEVKKAGDEAKKFSNENKKAARSLDQIAKAAAQAGAALAAMRASAVALTATTGAFGRFEANIARVASIAGMAGNEIRKYTEEFRELDRTIKVIPTDQLAEMEATLAQMGVANEDLAKVGDTVAKLALASGQAADYVAEVAQRLLYVSKEPLSQLERFGDTLSYLDRNAAATSKAILDMANNIAISMPQYKVSSAGVLALATSMANAGMRAEITRSAFQRVMAVLYSGSKKGSTAFQDFLNRVGMTKEQFDELAESKPEEILLRFSDAYNAMAEKGQGTDFLRQFGIQAQETEIVLGVLGKRAQEVRQYLNDLASGVQIGDLQRRFNIVNETQVADLQGMIKAWNQLKAAIGEALAPLVQPVLEGLTEGAYVLRDLFDRLSPVTKAVLGTIITIGPAVLSAVTAFKALNTVFGNFAKGGLVSALMGSKSSIARAGEAMGEVYGKSFGRRAGRVLGALKLAVKVAIVWEVANAIGDFITEQIDSHSEFRKQFEGFFDFMAQNPFTGVIQSGPNAGRNFWTGEIEYIQDAQGQWIEYTETVKQQLEEAERARREAAANASGIPVPPIDTESPLAGGGMPSMTLHEVTVQLQEQIAEAEALTAEAQARVEKERLIREAVKDTSMGYDEVNAQIGGLIDKLQRARTLAAFNDLIIDLDKRVDSARAVTKDAQNELEIRQQIADFEREHGKLTDGQNRSIRERLHTLQEIEKTNAYEEMARELRRGLEDAQALTEARKTELSVMRQIEDTERSIGSLTAGRRKEIERLIRDTRQAELFRDLEDQLDPVSAAIRRYQDNVRTLNAELARGLDPERYAQLIAQLDQATLAARDPFADRVRSFREELQLLSIMGDYQEADRQAQQEINELRRRGVALTGDQVIAMRELHRAIADVRKEQESGFVGWAHSIGSLKNNILDLQKSLADGVSDAIVGLITGTKNAINDFILSIGKQTLTLFTNQVLKDFVAGLGNNPGGIFSFLGIGSAQQRAQAALNGASLSNVGVMNVTAASVNIGGAGLPAGYSQAASGPVGLGPNFGLGAVSVRELPSIEQINEAVAGAMGSAVDLATQYVGMHEVTNRSQINAFLRAGGVNLDAAQQAWCAAFVNSALKQVGVEGTGTMVASDFLNWGQAVNPANLRRGDILIDHRGVAPGMTGAHVGFATGAERLGPNGMQFEMLSGNSANQVQTTWVDAQAVEIRRATEQLAQASQQLQQLGNSVEQAGMNAQTASDGMSQLNLSTQMTGANANATSGSMFTLSASAAGAGANVEGASMSTDNLGRSAMTAAPQIEQAGQALQNAGAAAASAAASAQGGGSLGSFGLNPLSLLGYGLRFLRFHKGGLVHAGHNDSVHLPAAFAMGAPRFHKGLKSDEFAAVLQRGERVLTANDNERVERVLRTVAENGQRVEPARREAAAPVIMNINGVTDAPSFQRAQSQILSRMQAAMVRARARTS